LRTRDGPESNHVVRQVSKRFYTSNCAAKGEFHGNKKLIIVQTFTFVFLSGGGSSTVAYRVMAVDFNR